MYEISYVLNWLNFWIIKTKVKTDLRRRQHEFLCNVPTQLRATLQSAETRSYRTRQSVDLRFMQLNDQPRGQLRLSSENM